MTTRSHITTNYPKTLLYPRGPALLALLALTLAPPVEHLDGKAREPARIPGNANWFTLWRGWAGELPGRAGHSTP